MPEASRQARIAYDRGIPDSRAARCAHLRDLLGELYNPAVASPDFVPKPAHDNTPTVSPEERRAAEAALARLHATSAATWRSEEHTSELQSLMRISYAVLCLTKKTT